MNHARIASLLVVAILASGCFSTNQIAPRSFSESMNNPKYREEHVERPTPDGRVELVPIRERYFEFESLDGETFTADEPVVIIRGNRRTETVEHPFQVTEALNGFEVRDESGVEEFDYFDVKSVEVEYLDRFTTGIVLASIVIPIIAYGLCFTVDQRR